MTAEQVEPRAEVGGGATCRAFLLQQSLHRRTGIVGVLPCFVGGRPSASVDDGGG